MKIFVTVLTLAAIFASSEAITYGYNVAEHRFPFQVGISEYPSKNAYVRCGGALIRKNWIITAAECVDNLAAVTLHIGSTNFSNPNWTRTIAANKIIMHPNYNRISSKDNIALIETPIHLEISEKINKVFLPTVLEESHMAHHSVIFLGWGKDQHGKYRNILQSLYMGVMTNENCQSLLKDIHIDEKILCTTTEFGSPCSGDIGGPLIRDSDNMLIGISAFLTNKDCRQDAPAGFMRVTAYRDWIKSVSGV